MVMESVNPATEEVMATFEEFTPQQIESALASSEATFRRWRRTSFAERSARMREAARYLRSNKERFGLLITHEMGKPIVEAEAEVEKCAWNCDYYAENAERFLADEEVATNARKSYIAYTPLGVILAVMP